MKLVWSCKVLYALHHWKVGTPNNISTDQEWDCTEMIFLDFSADDHLTICLHFPWGFAQFLQVSVFFEPWGLLQISWTTFLPLAKHFNNTNMHSSLYLFFQQHMTQIYLCFFRVHAQIKTFVWGQSTFTKSSRSKSGRRSLKTPTQSPANFIFDWKKNCLFSAIEFF